MISHKHKFIFTHINKCGGTTIDTMLIKYCDGFKQSHAATLLETLHSPTPVNKLYGELNQVKHLSARQTLNSKSQNYFKFSFVRNPWDKLVSAYFYRKHRSGRYKSMNFRQFVKYRVKHWKINTTYSGKLNKKFFWSADQYDWLCGSDGEVIVDFVGKVENFQNDFNHICDRIGIPQERLPHINKTKHKHYTEYYDVVTREIVERKFAKDIEYFGYKFGE